MEEKEEENSFINRVRNRNRHSRYFHGGIHEDDEIELMKFREICKKINLKYNYDGGKKECGYSIMLKLFNQIMPPFIPIAKACNSNPVVFSRDIMDKFLECFVLECKKNNLTIQIETFKNELTDKTVTDTTKNLQLIAVKRNKQH